MPYLASTAVLILVDSGVMFEDQFGGLRKSILELAESIRSKATSRGCGPILWKWVMKQPFSDLF